MDHNHEHRDDAEPPAIQNRRDAGGPWSTAWPLLALALIGLMLVRACVPGLPASFPAPPAPIAPAAR
jgi:hypothetical protein